MAEIELSKVHAAAQERAVAAVTEAVDRARGLAANDPNLHAIVSLLGDAIETVAEMVRPA